MSVGDAKTKCDLIVHLYDKEDHAHDPMVHVCMYREPIAVFVFNNLVESQLLRQAVVVDTYPPEKNTTPPFKPPSRATPPKHVCILPDYTDRDCLTAHAG